MNLMNLSKQSRQHLVHPRRHLVAKLFPEAAATFSPTYSKIDLTSQTIAIRSEPKARVPAWYLIDHQKPFQTSESPGIPSSSGISFLEKYQVQVETITTNSLIATRNAIIQRIPKYMKKAIYLVFESQVTSFY